MRMPSGSRTKSKNFKTLTRQELEDLTMQQLKSDVTRTTDWKSSDPDKLHSFRLKHFTSLQNNMANAFSHTHANQEHVPECLIEGTTFLLSKKDEHGYQRTTNQLHACQSSSRSSHPLENIDYTASYKIKPSWLQNRGGVKKDCYGWKDKLKINNTILEN